MVEAFVTSATLEIRFMPCIRLDLAARIAQALLAEAARTGSRGAQAHVISRDDHLSISIEDVEEIAMTPAAYGELLGRLQDIARSMSHRG